MPARLLEEGLTRSIIGAFYASYTRLGYGFSEHVCSGGFVIELERRGHAVAREFPIEIRYDGTVVGVYRADLVVDSKVIVEVKAEPCITSIHCRQLRNYLAGTPFEVGLILCYGLKPQFKRMIHTVDRKAIDIRTRSVHSVRSVP